MGKLNDGNNDEHDEIHGDDDYHDYDEVNGDDNVNGDDDGDDDEDSGLHLRSSIKQKVMLHPVRPKCCTNLKIKIINVLLV